MASLGRGQFQRHFVAELLNTIYSALDSRLFVTLIEVITSEFMV